MRKRPCTSACERAEVGSSMMRTRTSWVRALAISTICCWPMRRLLTSSSGSMSCSRRASSSRAFSRSALRSMATPRTSSWARKRLSRTDRLAQRLSSWKMMPTPCCAAAVTLGSSTGWPSMSTRPEVGCSTPARIFMSVDLPAPFSPTSTLTWPAWTSKLTSSRAVVPGKTFVMCSARMGTSAIAGGSATGWGSRAVVMGRRSRWARWTPG